MVRGIFITNLIRWNDYAFLYSLDNVIVMSSSIENIELQFPAHISLLISVRISPMQLYDMKDRNHR